MSKIKRAQKCVAENGEVSIPQSLPTASQEARRELEQPRAGFSSLAALPFSTKLYRTILHLKAIQFACSSAAQEDIDNAIITLDKEAQEALEFAVKELEKKLHRRNKKNSHR